MAMTQSAIARTRRFIGCSQNEFAEYANINPTTYSVHESNPEAFRVRELQRIANRLGRKDQLLLASAIVATIFGEGMEVTEK